MATKEMCRDFIFGSILKRIESRVSERCLHTHIYSSLIHSTRKVGAAQMFIDGWMGKQNEEGREGHSDTRYNMDEPGRHRSDEISQSQGDTYCVLPLIRGTWSS